MTFEEAIAAPGRKFQAWGDEVQDGNRVAMIYRLGEGGAEQLAWRQVPEGERSAVTSDLEARGLPVAGYDFFSGFIWVVTDTGVEVYHRTGKVLEATGDRATIEDGRVIPRSEIETVIAFANDDYVYRGVKATLRSGQEVPLVTEASSAAMGDPTYSRNELLMETSWAGILGRAIASWAGARFDDRI
ncbi:MAG: hypothetical protein H0T46_26905 [Deltaproteobacteria bacterium]|nr:hypothetical protein [Deltaproteobacteria bacterium]